MDTPDEAWTSSFESVFVGGLRVARAVANAVDGTRLDRVRAVHLGARSRCPTWPSPTGCGPGWRWSPRQLADELGPRDIRVNGLLPGRVGTERVAELDASTGDADAAREKAIAGIPLGRYGEPEEFAAAAAFLLSPASSFVSGTMLPVDGGMLRAL